MLEPFSSDSKTSVSAVAWAGRSGHCQAPAVPLPPTYLQRLDRFTVKLVDTDEHVRAIIRHMRLWQAQSLRWLLSKLILRFSEGTRRVGMAKCRLIQP